MKICIIKLGAKGDVVRTLPVLLGIKQKYPDSEITWITKQSSQEIVENSPHVHKIFTLPDEPVEKFNILYNFDIDEQATQLAEKIQADKKLGFYSQDGFAQAFNFSAEYYLNTLFDDQLKKQNKKTYQQIMFETAELEYNKQHHPITLSEQDEKFAQDFANQNNINTEKLIGIHYGASPRWPSKKWHKDNLIEFIKKATEKNYEILLFGGPDEAQEHEQLFNNLIQKGIKIYRNNPQNSDKEFFSLVNLCTKIICGDTFALHVALALKKPTTGLFFCTPSNEIEGYGLLKKITSPELYNFFPEKCDQYDEELTKSISAQEVLDSLEQ